MSENEDFFLDEDFLNDLDQTSQLYYSQIENIEDNISTNKRRKLNQVNIDNEIISSKYNGDKTTGKSTELSSRKNLILDIFENNSTAMANEESVLTAINSTTSSFCVKNYSSDHDNSKRTTDKLASSSAKKLALEIMEKKYFKPDQNNIKSPLKNSKQLMTISHTPDIMQTPNDILQSTKITADTDKYSPDLFKTPLPCQPKTLVRKFPGPAGLIPDGLKNTLKNPLKVTLKDNLVDDAIYYLQNLHDNEMTVSKETSHLSEFCSQETKKLFSDGAWSRMLNDLPPNFLRGHDIASLKRPGRSNKVPLLAAFIHHIDHNAENPRIILKDISNSIEAIMHKDIPTKYPNILQSGVVVLLRDIGILNFQGAQKYSTISLVMIPSNSILGVYTDKERLVTTPALNEILRGNYDIEPTEIINNTSKYKATPLELTNKNNNSSMYKQDKHKQHIQQKINLEFIQQDLENINPIENFDDMSDIDFDEPSVKFKQNDVQSITITSVNNDETFVQRSTIEEQPNNSLIDNNSLSTILPSVIDNNSTKINSSNDTTISPTTGFADDLFNDTDDEILSQFDVDSIANTHDIH